jgi:hypothetical protein
MASEVEFWRQDPATKAEGIAREVERLSRQARAAGLSVTARLSRAAFFKRLALLDTQGLELLVALHPRVWWARRAGRLASVRRASSKAPNTPNLETRA